MTVTFGTIINVQGCHYINLPGISKLDVLRGKILKESVTKYTVEEAKTFVENYDLDFAPELILYQLGYNDINS